ncbi:MAG: hypothetical protein Q8K79_05190 [Solirubrobacteraceae bacterium]|nr:hypothetical protein [Solirubrobacteraceae bacterium]
MKPRRIAALALSGALIAGGAGAAIAAVTKDGANKTEQAILDDAAKRLDVTPDKLRDALSAAQDAQLDQAVKAGDLTQKQADAIKQARKASGRVLAGPGLLGGPGPHGAMKLHGGPGGRGAHHLGLRGDLFADLAKALGTTESKLKEQLRDGTSVAEVAKANGKSLADVRAAVKAATKTRLDEAVKDGDLTRKQADAILDRVEDHVTAIGSRKGLRLRRHHFRGGAPPVPAPRPGSFMPGGPDEVRVVPGDGIIL